MLRPYQQEAHDAAMSWIKKNTAPGLIEAATGAGKSHVIASVAEDFHDLSGKRVLCTAPNSDLVMQNHAKYIATGSNASIFSASLGIKSLRHPVVFGTPGSIKNSISRFGSQFGLIIPDEGEGITPTMISIIDAIRKENPRLRLTGLTATPFLLGKGLVYAMDENGKPSNPNECRDPYYTKKIYSVKARRLIDEGYLTEPFIGQIHGEHYDTMKMEVQGNGHFKQSDIDKAFHGQGRKTSRIIEDIITQSWNRNGVMIFAATVQHALECMESLPRELSRMIGGKINTGTEDRKRLVRDFKERKFKYLVSVGTMTTGIDFTHVDVIAILRASESMRLLLQIIGRGGRVEYAKGYALETMMQRLLAIAKGIKPNFLVLDYAENFDRHCPDGDIYNPQIKATKGKQSTSIVVAKCELCNVQNEFSGRPNDEGFGYDEYGYFTDLDGNRIDSGYGDMPSHYGRRCMALHRQPSGEYEQCTYRWTYKTCTNEECEEQNDIAARYCRICRTELVNPNDKLIIDFKARKKDPTLMQCDAVLSWDIKETITSKNESAVIVTYVTDYRTFNIWYIKDSKKKLIQDKYNLFMKCTNDMEIMPTSVTYRKEDGFYTVYAYCQEVDQL